MNWKRLKKRYKQCSRVRGIQKDIFGLDFVSYWWIADKGKETVKVFQNFNYLDDSMKENGKFQSRSWFESCVLSKFLFFLNKKIKKPYTSFISFVQKLKKKNRNWVNNIVICIFELWSNNYIIGHNIISALNFTWISTI